MITQLLQKTTLSLNDAWRKALLGYGLKCHCAGRGQPASDHGMLQQVRYAWCFCLLRDSLYLQCCVGDYHMVGDVHNLTKFSVWRFWSFPSMCEQSWQFALVSTWCFKTLLLLGVYACCGEHNWSCGIAEAICKTSYLQACLESCLMIFRTALARATKIKPDGVAFSGCCVRI